MDFQDDTAGLSLALKSLYGDILDFPLLKQDVEPGQKFDASRALSTYEDEIKFCKKCVLHIGRRNLVFGKGAPDARIAFVGDFPSLKDDAAGEPFTDEAGELLHKMIVAMKVKPEEVYLTNIFKCRPPQGQVVDQDLFRLCEEHIEAQFRLLPATIIVTLGEHSSKALARSESPLPVLRGQKFEWNSRKVFCTHHPRDLLASPAKKKEAWGDLQAVMRELQ